MIQVFIFHGYSLSGQTACVEAAEKANRFLQKYQVTNPHITTGYATSYSSDIGNCACECAVTVVAQVETPIVYSQEDFADKKHPVPDWAQGAVPADTGELLDSLF